MTVCTSHRTRKTLKCQGAAEKDLKTKGKVQESCIGKNF